jgi:murein DD-endopeptidase MepM/ murein hydrolase activator NlpD
MAMSLVLVLGMLLHFQHPLSAMQLSMPNSYASPSELEDAKDEKDKVEDELQKAEDNVAALSSEVGTLSGDLEVLEGLSAEQKAQYLEISQELAAALIAKKEALNLYIDSQNTLAQKTTEYSERISVMFELQNKSTLEVLLESDSLAGFFVNLELIELIGDSDKQIMEGMKAAMDDASLKSEYALQEAEDMQVVADQKEAELKELEARIGETTAVLERKQSELSEWEKKEEELEAESERLEGEIAELQRRLYETKPGNSGGTAPPQGSMTWPYPGDYTIYSPFGVRFHPIYRVYKMHNGVDLGGSYGNPIVAASSGTVIKADAPVRGQNTGGKNFGNHVIIDHGGGVSTIYAHCKDLYVSVGQEVSAGETIASCGSTGTSTGPHLHFEVRVNGVPVDPANYIT